MVNWGKVAGNTTSTTANYLKKNANSVDVTSLKKMETPEMTARYGDTVSNSSFYAKYKGKLTAKGLGLGAVAAWYGSLLAQGHSPSEAWDEMTETLGDATGAAASAVLEGMWNAFVQMVHSSVGYKVFDSVDTTDRVLKAILVFLCIYRVLSLFGINLFKLL
ncbi:FirrV-1-E2 [Feldmannia irregularis virus a]|uniref:FirrV-1-E2 n=1 Tax=Feldmannia irregularis virus a TaxID=231992 RepID=Q6XLW0_9PHYC|nr:FirrV-1-E2 [Feldmannia irregularis virus a]AAR26951.1 FirrV-1-E2 [Feldmannia irregularis virus a]